VQLLNQLESEYQASVDFVRTIKDVEQGDLLQNSRVSNLKQTMNANMT
jgi:hypothetical protein